MTVCECTKSGWCQRHQCHKTAHWVGLCQTREDYFQLWEQGRGPGQMSSKRRNPAATHPCEHQGDVLRLEECDSCQGRVRVKVIVCTMHGSCTIGSIVQEPTLYPAFVLPLVSKSQFQFP